MTWITYIITSLGAVGLLSTGIYLSLLDKTATAATAFSFGFLLVVLLLVSKFKRVKGFGFEAEMWEEKQIEAAALVDRLTLLSDTVTRQVALIAARLGRWDSSFSLPEMADLIEQIDHLLVAAKSTRPLRDDIITPLYERVENDYWNAALSFIDRTMRKESDEIRKRLDAAKPEEKEPLYQ